MCVIEYEERVDARQKRYGKTEGVRWSSRETLGEAHEIVAEVADEAAHEGHPSRGGLHGAENLPEALQRRPVERSAPRRVLHLQPIREESVELARPAAEEAVPRDLLAAGHALEEKPGMLALEPAVERYWRQAVAEELADPRRGSPRAAHRASISSSSSATSSLGISRPVMAANCGIA